MPRAKRFPQKLVKVTNGQSSTNTWVFLVKDDTLDKADDNQSEVVNLRHPASNKPAVFVFSPGNLTVQEILIFDENKRSWFIDDNVKSDGKLHMSTLIDPIFLILPYLKKSQLAQPLEQCLWDEDYPETSRLAQCKDLDLSLVADRKGDESLQAFKFNEEKSLNWLQKKVKKVIDALKDKEIHVSRGAISATYVKHTKCGIGTEEEYLRYAHGIVSEYLDEDLSKKLAQHLNIPDDVETKKRKLNSPQNETNKKKLKTEEISSEENVATKTKRQTKSLKISEKTQKTTAPSKKELAKQKAAAGSKSITSFFQKK